MSNDININFLLYGMRISRMECDVQAYTNIVLLIDAVANTMFLYAVYKLVVFCCAGNDTWQ